MRSYGFLNEHVLQLYQQDLEVWSSIAVIDVTEQWTRGKNNYHVVDRNTEGSGHIDRSEWIDMVEWVRV